MYEHVTLQEAYTGALIAGKGKALNNINLILDRTKTRTEDWARVRFGAGTPWRRCWCVITPPDEKEVQRLQKQMSKKKSAYDRSRPPALKGDIKFYDSKKTKKLSPIATIRDAYSAYAIYPQAKPLIDASTLVKVEGSITIHSNPPSTTEGFVFVMPEVHPAVSGFEMMLRWLFPVFDTYALYGRPGRLIADTNNPQSLMFAMPKHRRYGYLEILDVTGLILEQGSSEWKESEWRRRMKELTSKRMAALENGSQRDSRYSSRRSTRNSFGPSRSRIHFDDAASTRSSPSIGWGQSPQAEPPLGAGIPRTDSAPPGIDFPKQPPAAHHRSVSETQVLDRFANVSANYDGAYEQAPTPPPHNMGAAPGREGSGLKYMNEMGSTPERVSSEDERAARATPVRELQDLRLTTSPEPVAAPPAFSHAPGSVPASKPYHSPDLRRANSRMSNGTLSQLAGAAGAGGFTSAVYHAGGDIPRTSEEQRLQSVGRSEDRGQGDQRGVLSDANKYEFPANSDGLNEGLVAAPNRFSFDGPSPPRPLNVDAQSDHYQPPPRLSYTTSIPQPFPKDNPTSIRTYDPPQVFTSPDPNLQAIRSTPYSHSHASQQSTDSTHSTVSQPSRLLTGQGVMRKPLPAHNSPAETPVSADTPSSSGSLGQHVLDLNAFDMIKNPGNRKMTLLADRGRSDTASSVYPEDIPPHRRQTLQPPMPPLPDLRDRSNTETSVYEDDTLYEKEPDYASTSRPSSESHKSVEKPRAGVMRTVGNVQDGPSYSSSALPSIDFGPTMNLASDRALRQRSPVRRGSPGPTQKYIAERTPRYESPTPGTGPNRDSRSPSRNAIPPEGTHYRNDSGESRTLAWQPGMSAIGSSSSAITPEQFVQQRAAAATPLYAHQRQASGNTLGRNTPTPPLVRNRSSDFLAQQGHSRHTSADLLHRPGSRGASAAIGPSGSGDIPSTLSAREQEHIARTTGQPLINVPHSNRQGPGAGLVGAIEFREKEKQQMKQGINSQAVQQAIAQRQQQQASYQQYPEQVTEYYAPQSQYGTMGQYPDHSQRQQSWVSPAANVFAQGGGWSGPAQGHPVQGHPLTPEKDSPHYSPPPASFFATPSFPPSQGGQGRGGFGYQGGH
jgi:CCR4-NOT transcriptional complex subunit CAF120